MLPQDDFLALQNIILDTLSKYIKTIRTDGSWIQYYVERFGIKPPVFVFNESQDTFHSKLIQYFDILDLAHLFCKITNEKEYVAEQHEFSRIQKTHISEKFKILDTEQWTQMRAHLKNFAVCGTN